MKKAICKFLFFKLAGWHIKGHINKTVKKQVVVAGPHTSFLDFPVGICTRIVEEWNVQFIGKKSLFNGPFGWLFRSLGGMPVDRTKNNNMVDSLIALFESHEELVIALAPEGTRNKVEKLRTGFYYVALGAKVPILMVGFDFKKKEVEINELFYPSGDVEIDIAYITNYFKGVSGKYPANGI